MERGNLVIGRVDPTGLAQQVARAHPLRHPLRVMRVG
jgi:hypothetical protein